MNKLISYFSGYICLSSLNYKYIQIYTKMRENNHGKKE